MVRGRHDTDALEGLARGLGDVRASLVGDVARAGRISAGQLGSSELDAELDRFVADWRRGRGRLEEELDRAERYVRSAALNYADVEAALLRATGLPR